VLESCDGLSRGHERRGRSSEAITAFLSFLLAAPFFGLVAHLSQRSVGFCVWAQTD
jgi:hypothetical protein